MKKTILLSIMVCFLAMSCAGMTGGIHKKSVSSACIEKVDVKPDQKGNYFVYVTIKNVSGKDMPFYLELQADDQVSQFTASGKKRPAQYRPRRRELHLCSEHLAKNRAQETQRGSKRIIAIGRMFLQTVSDDRDHL
jgi:hypothetical protein